MNNSGGGPKDFGSVMTMYGMSPTQTSPRDWGAQGIQGIREAMQPVFVPETAEAVRKRIDARIAWLQNELRMHDTWKEELVVLCRMIGIDVNASDSGSGADHG